MISIITPIHNKLNHNKLFWESLVNYTFFPFELIIIDNHSTDGSEDFFEAKPFCSVIKLPYNLCYPESINLGLKMAKYEYVCLLNNDVYLGVHWDKYLIEAMEKYNLCGVSPIGVERMPTQELTDKFSHKWKKIGRKKHVKFDEQKLRNLLSQMYGDWEQFCRNIKEEYYPQIIEGIVGCCVMLKREVLEKLGGLDERVQAADWDLYLRIREREEEVGDVVRIKTVCWSYVHHFIRATLKSKPEPFACKHPKLTIKEKWSQEQLEKYWPFKNEIIPKPSLLKSPLAHLKNKIFKLKRG